MNRIWEVELLPRVQIAKCLGVTENTVSREVERLGLQRPEDKKRCSRCQLVKDRDLFKGTYGCCKLCVKEKRMIKDYGITLPEFKELVIKQRGNCAICNANCVYRKGERGPQLFHVDHCHTSGRVRGLLCLNCNLGLGKFKDDPALLQAAIAYLTGMSFRKYQKVEDASVVSPQEHKEIEDELHKLGKTSATQLTDEEREEVFSDEA